MKVYTEIQNKKFERFETLPMENLYYVLEKMIKITLTNFTDWRANVLEERYQKQTIAQDEVLRSINRSEDAPFLRPLEEKYEYLQETTEWRDLSEIVDELTPESSLHDRKKMIKKLPDIFDRLVNIMKLNKLRDSYEEFVAKSDDKKSSITEFSRIKGITSAMLKKDSQRRERCNSICRYGARGTSFGAIPHTLS